MTTAGLKKQYEFYQAKEESLREEINRLRRSLTDWSRLRKEAHRQWQVKLKADAK